MNNTATDRFNRILLIDDEPGIRKMVSLDLTADGYECLTAGDGAAGLDVFEAEKPDIVLTDIKMPGMDGLEVLRRIKAMSPDTEVIVITGHGDMNAAVESLQLAASDFITKPISDAALNVALKRAAERLEMKSRLAAYTLDLEARVEEAAARLIKAERLAAIGQTVASLAHTVKNILGGLKGGLYVAGQGCEQGDPRMMDQGLEMLERNIDRVSDFVGDLLTMSTPRQPEREDVDPAGLVEEAIEVLSARAGRLGVGLEAAEMPQGLIAGWDRRAVLGALMNIVSNAVEAAAEHNDGRVEVALKTEGDLVVLEVTDNGPGLTPEAESKVFQGFFSTKGSGGTGLGLMVSQKIAREHGGRIELDNNRARGARFSLVLPRDPGVETGDGC